MTDAIPAAERAQQCRRIFSNVCDRLTRPSDSTTPEHSRRLLSRLAHGMQSHIEGLAPGITYRDVLLEMSEKMEAYVARYRHDSRFERKQRHVSAMRARVAEQVSLLVAQGEAHPRTATVFLSTWPSLSSIGDYSAMVRSATGIAQCDVGRKNQALVGEVNKLAALYAGGATQQIEDFLHVNAHLGRQVRSRIYVSARLDGAPDTVIAAWRCTIQRTGLQNEVYFKLATRLSRRFESIVVFQTAKTTDAHIEYLMSEFLRNCPPQLLAENDAPTGVPWQRGICIAPEPATINTYVRYAGGRSKISYNQLIAAVTELAFELACDDVRRNDASPAPQSFARLAEAAATYFEQMIKLSDINPDTMAAPLHGGRWPGWMKAL